MLIQSPKIPKTITSNPRYAIAHHEDRQFFFQEVNEVLSQSYPRFLIEDFVNSEIWKRFFYLYPEFQFGLVEVATQKIVAQGSCLPLPWHQSLEYLPNTGCDWALTTGLEAKYQNIEPTILSAVSVAILPEYRGRGLSSYLLDYMLELARCYQFPTLILAARPALKHLYPLTPMERYIEWKDEAGFSFDPWLRTNLKRGAKKLRICDRSTVMNETISHWERLTGMRFPETGSYIIPGGIVPLEINYLTNQGSYIEPNVWFSYSIV